MALLAADASSPTLLRQRDSVVVAKVPSTVANGLEVENKPPGECHVDYESPSASDQEEFREGGYGWVVVIAVHLINAHTWGINSSYSVFLAYYLRSDSFAGASAVAYAFVGGLSVSISLLISPIATVCIRVYGTRKTLFLGIILETIAFIGASFTTQMWHLILSQGIAFGLGMGFTFVASVGVVPQWFTRRRSLANGIAAGGSGMGGLIYALATNAMLKNIGLAWAFRVLAILSLVVNGTSAILMRDRNKQVGAIHVAFHKDLFKRPEYYLLLSWAFFSLLGYIVVVFSLPDYCQTVGLSATQGSIVAACFNLSQGLGRPIIGLASDRFGRINIAALGTLTAGFAAFFLWIFAAKFFAGAIVYALLGVFSGILWATISPVCAEVIGIQLLPSGLSIVWLVLVLPATFAEVIGLSLRRPGTDVYLHVQMFTGVTYLIAFASAWVLRGWKLYELETLHLNKEQREQAARDNDAAAANIQTEVAAADESQAAITTQGLLAYLMKVILCPPFSLVGAPGPDDDRDPIMFAQGQAAKDSEEDHPGLLVAQ